MKQSITVAEARDIVLATVVALGAEKVPITEGLGRVLAEDVGSPWDLPPCDNTGMDGFAVRFADVASASRAHPVQLKILENLPAGYVATQAVTEGTAIRIMTGAPVPAGADAIVRREDTQADEATVSIMAAAQPGEHIRRAGEDVREGQAVLAAGAVLTAGAVGMLASLGRSFVQVTQRPRVAVISTGDELVDVDGDRRDGRIIASNTYSLAAQVLECGGIPVLLGIAPDTMEAIEAKFREAMTCDVILSSGGVSVGDYDFINDVLRNLGSEMKFWKVAMKPGHPLAFGLLGTKPTFGLPGNPVSSMVSFEQFVRPALLRMMGHRDVFRPVIRARATESLRQKPGRMTFLRAIVARAGEGYTVSTTGTQSSGVLSSMVRANGLLLFPADLAEIAEGSLVDVQIIDPSFWQMSTPGFSDHVR
jgi:molybdopterin molybdotransferase